MTPATPRFWHLKSGGEGNLVLWFAAVPAVQAVGGIMSSDGLILRLLGWIFVIVALSKLTKF